MKITLITAASSGFGRAAAQLLAKVRVNIDNIEIMPIDQTYGGAATSRREVK